MTKRRTNRRVNEARDGQYSAGRDGDWHSGRVCRAGVLHPAAGDIAIMQYMGGKARIATDIANTLNACKPVNYYEPFCGGLWVSQYVIADHLYLSDVSEPLITLYKAMREGWVPPSIVTEGDYKHYQSLKDSKDPMTGFVGYGCSFSGKYFGGYARSGARNYALNAKNSLLRKFKALRDKQVTFTAHDYARVMPSGGDVVYCDPPYQGTTGYAIAPDFDWAGFWAWVRERSQAAKIFTSSYEAPHGFWPILTIPTKTDMHTKHGKEARAERVFIWHPM